MSECLYTNGGTVQAQEGALYLVRPADEQLLELCRQSRFAYVLTPRQLGKSSLMIRTAEQLLAEGFRAVMVDLTQIGTHAEADTWYGDVLEVVADQLELATDARAWWKKEADTGLTLRLTRFFEEVVLAEVSEPIVIFVDEIDTTLSLAFTDDFFAAIRYFYVARAQNPALRRLSFVLIGVATPADLIRDPKRTPFNIGERVDLRDFTPQEAMPLAQGLPLPPPEAEQALGWILGWTGGHPYLSQRLCSVLAENPPAEWSEAAVDQAVGRTFFGERSKQDNNLQFVRDMLTKRAPRGYGAELLRTYRRIWQDKQAVVDEEQNIVHAHLKLAGVVRRDGSQLLVRNRLYQAVFDAAWIEEINPNDFWKRYGPVLKWALPVLVAAVMVAGVMGALALEARSQATIATLREEVTKVSIKMNTDEMAPGLVLALDAWARSQSVPAVEGASDSALLLAWLGAKETNLLEHAQGVDSVAYSPDSRRIASGSKDGSIQIWDAEIGAALTPPLKGHGGEVLSIAFNPDGSQIASGSSDGTLRLWDAKSGAALGAPLKGHEGEVMSVAYSPDGDQIASGGSDGTVRLWDAKSGEPLGPPLKGHVGGVTSVAYSPDGRQIASGSWDRTVRLWDAKNGEALGPPLKGHVGGVTSVAYSPDGRQIASGSWDRTVCLWDATNGKPLGPPLNGHESGVTSVAYSPDGRQIASGSWDRTVRLWDAKNGAALGPPLKGHAGGVMSVAYSPDGRQIASGSNDRTVRLWDTKSGAALGPPLHEYGREILSVAYSPDGSQIVSGSNDGTVRIWEAESRTALVPPLKAHEGVVMSVAYSPDGRQIASGSKDGTLRLWDAKTGAALGAPLKAHDGEVMSVAYSPDGDQIASGGSDGTLRLWDAKSGAALGAPLKGHEGELMSVAYSPDGDQIASGGSDGTVRLWDAKSGEPLGPPLREHVGGVTSVAYSPDGRQIASGSWDRTVRLWDAKNGEALGQPLKGHVSGVTSVAYSPDGRQIASGSWDRTVRLWDAKNGAALGPPLKGHAGGVTSVAYSPDGRQLASGSQDGTVRRWITSPEEWFRLSCAHLAYHPLLRDPASVSSDQELVAAGKRVAQACQATSRSALQAQRQGPRLAFGGLLSWVRGLLGR